MRQSPSKNVILWALLNLIILPIFLSGKIQHTCEKWEKMDIRLKSDTEFATPFEVSFGAVFTHEHGETLTIPGFYDGDNTWIVRFCPSIKGKWTYKTFSDDTKLENKQGQIQVTPSNSTKNHGPLIIDPSNPQALSYSDGTPYFLLGYELDWLFALDSEHSDDIPKTKEILNHIEKNGFNHLIMNVYAYDSMLANEHDTTWRKPSEMKSEHDYSKPQIFPFGGTNESPDYSTLNITFFRHLDRILEELKDRNIIAHLMIYVWNKQVNWPEANSIADNRYFDYIIKRYQAYPHLMWDISKEALGYGHDDIDYITDRINRLRNLDAHKRLVTVHDFRYCSKYSEKVDLISTQTWKYNLYDHMLQYRHQFKNKPVLNIEHGGYEKTTYQIFNGAYGDPKYCLDRNYQCVFAGIYSTYYWQNTSWYNIIYNPLDLPKENQPHFHYYKHLAQLFQDYNFNNLRPSQDGTYGYCLTDEQSISLIYLPKEMKQVSCRMNFLKGKKVEVKWMSVFTGEFSEPEIIDYANVLFQNVYRPANIQEGPAIAIVKLME